MNISNTILSKFIIYSLTLLAVISFNSCEDNNVGEFKLTGNIENLIPKDSYSLHKSISKDGRSIIFTPELNSNFKYWGLTLKKVDYFIDEVFYKTEMTSPCELVIDKNNIEPGSYKLKAKMTIVGADCNDVILEIEDIFSISSSGSISERHGLFYIDYNFVRPGDILEVTPQLIQERSTEGCEIDKVDYYWDNTLISTETSAPFTLKYKVKAEAETTHQLRLVIGYHDKYSHNLTYNWCYANYKVYSDDTSFTTWNIQSGLDDYKNGETLLIVAKKFEGANSKNTDEIEFYFDNVLIGKASTYPYKLDYKLDNVSKGSHVVEGKTIRKVGNTSYSISHMETIFVTR